MNAYNIIMSAVIIIAIFVVLYYFMKPDPLAELEVSEQIDPFSLQALTVSVKDYFGEYDKLNVSELNMNKAQSDKVESDKRKLSRARKTCCYGDTGSKYFVKEKIKKVLIEVLGVTPENIGHAISFYDYDKLSVREKFDILLHIYKKQFGNQAMKQLILVNHFDVPFGEGAQVQYKITAPQIRQCFNQHLALVEELEYEDCLELLTERIYANFIGLGVVDELVEMDVDGVRGGTSGINESLVKVVGEQFAKDYGDLPLVSYNSIWIIFKGTEMHLSFLGFETQKEFVRVASRIYKYESAGSLDAASGGIIGKMMNGSRVVVTRPPFSESWAFFVRKLDVGFKLPLEVLMPDPGNQKLFKLIKFLVSGEENIALTGEQRTGKTTFMVSIIQFMKNLPIRILEKESEMNLRNVYPERDILSFKEIPTFSGQQALDLQKKTDGSVNLIGEVADYEQAAWAIQTGETGSNQVMFTGHMKTVPLLIDYFRSALLKKTPGSNAQIEESLCARVLNCNIHLSKTISGHRFVERVSMIIPHVMEDYPSEPEAAQKEYFRRQTDRPTFEWIDVLRWEDGVYRYTGEFTEEIAERIAFKLSDNERAEFLELCEEMRDEVRSGEVAS